MLCRRASGSRNVFIFFAKQSKKNFGLLDPENEGTAIFRNIGNCWPTERHSVTSQKAYNVSCTALTIANLVVSSVLRHASYTRLRLWLTFWCDTQLLKYGSLAQQTEKFKPILGHPPPSQRATWYYVCFCHLDVRKGKYQEAEGNEVLNSIIVYSVLVSRNTVRSCRVHSPTNALILI